MPWQKMKWLLVVIGAFIGSGFAAYLHGDFVEILVSGISCGSLFLVVMWL